MSRDELLNAYIEGSVSRRTFIRRLVGAGVSLGAAVSYAHLLSPGRAGAQTGPDFYNPEPNPTPNPNPDPDPNLHLAPQVQVDLASKKLSEVAKDGVLDVFVSIQEPAQLHLSAVATVRGKPAGAAVAAKRKRRRRRRVTIASQVIDFPTAGQRLIQLPLNSAGRKLIRKARKLNVLVSASATDRQGAVSLVSDVQSLKRKRKKRK